jgi:glycerophosphoryl diester phosphodiesterase
MKRIPIERRMAAIAVLGCAMAVIGQAQEHKTPLIVAHRGDSSNAPENTAAAIRAAVAAGADLIEFDTRETKDGALLLFHDADLKRYTGQKTAFEALGFQEARKLDVGSWFDEKKTFAAERPPTLEEAIRFCLEGGRIPLIERKTGTAAAHLKVIRDLKADERVIVQAFDWKFLTEFRALAPEIPIGALGSKKVDPERLAELERLKPDWIGWNHEFLDEAGIARFHAMGAKVAVWTVNDLARIRQFTVWGVDALITDRPGEARKAVQGLESR